MKGDALPREFREQQAASIAANLGLNVPSFELLDEMVIVGINRTYNMQTRGLIPGQWEQFVPQAMTMLGAAEQTMYGVCWNTKESGEFDYFVGLEAPNGAAIPKTFESMTIEARRYAIFAHTEHVTKLPKTLDTIWREWVPKSELKIAAAPCIERYTSEFDPASGMGGMDICIPLD